MEGKETLTGARAHARHYSAPLLYIPIYIITFHNFFREFFARLRYRNSVLQMDILLHDSCVRRRF